MMIEMMTFGDFSDDDYGDFSDDFYDDCHDFHDCFMTIVMHKFNDYHEDYFTLNMI